MQLFFFPVCPTPTQPHQELWQVNSFIQNLQITGEIALGKIFQTPEDPSGIFFLSWNSVCFKIFSSRPCLCFISCHTFRNTFMSEKHQHSKERLSVDQNYNYHTMTADQELCSVIFIKQSIPQINTHICVWTDQETGVQWLKIDHAIKTLQRSKEGHSQDANQNY